MPHPQRQFGSRQGEGRCCDPADGDAVEARPRGGRPGVTGRRVSGPRVIGNGVIGRRDGEVGDGG